eukprot:63045-Pyramimonas_sp.AAC.1
MLQRLRHQWLRCCLIACCPSLRGRHGANRASLAAHGAALSSEEGVDVTSREAGCKRGRGTSIEPRRLRRRIDASNGRRIDRASAR